MDMINSFDKVRISGFLTFNVFGFKGSYSLIRFASIFGNDEVLDCRLGNVFQTHPMVNRCAAVNISSTTYMISQAVGDGHSTIFGSFVVFMFSSWRLGCWL